MIFRKKAENYKLLSEITKRTRNWTAKVQQNKKYPTRQSHNNMRFHHLVFSDQNVNSINFHNFYSNMQINQLYILIIQGNQIQATMFGNEIATFERVLTPMKSYTYVKKIDPRFKIVANDYKWVIKSYTRIEDATGKESRRQSIYKFIPFSDFNDGVQSSSPIGKHLFYFHHFSPLIFSSR